MARPHNTPDVFRALAHPVRRRILELLRQGPRTATELTQPFEMSQPAISEHIRVLRLTGLITFQPRGAAHVYSLARQRLKPIEDWLRPFQRGSSARE